MRGPEAQELIEPAVISWDWLDGAAFHERHRWQGTRDPSPYLAVPAAIAFQAEHDWPAVRERCHALLASLELPFEPLTDDFVQMRGFRVEHPDPPALKRRLYDEHRIEVPIVETPTAGRCASRCRPTTTRPTSTALSRAVELEAPLRRPA